MVTDLTGGVAIEDIAHMTIDNSMRKRRAVHVAKPLAVEGGVRYDLGESVLRRIPDAAAHSFGEQVTGAFTWTRRTRELAEASRGHMSISPTSPQVVHSSSSSSSDETQSHWCTGSKPATAAAASDVPPSTAPPLFDALPAELVSAVAAALCTAAGLVAMGRTCRTWRLAVGGQGAPLWWGLVRRNQPPQQRALNHELHCVLALTQAYP